MTDALPNIAAVMKFLEDWAPPNSAQSYDNVGLQVGDPTRPVRKALIALDMTPAVLREAKSLGATLILTHHPLIFQPLRHLTPGDLPSSLALRLAEARIALYSIHTNLDAASGGVSFGLGEVLGIRDLTFLHRFENGDRPTGLGAVGVLEKPMPLRDFLTHVSDRLSAASLRYAGNPEMYVERVAVCGGAGADFVAQAVAAGAHAYVTSDVKYHRFFDVLDNDGEPRMAFIDAGHYETESMAIDLLRRRLDEHFHTVEWRSSAIRTSPMRTFAPVL